MADIHIVREHALGFDQARKLALRWAQVAQKKLEMECSYAEGEGADMLTFRRPGAHGHLKVTQERFELRARLGLLLGMFRHRIETEIVSNLDQLLVHTDPLYAFEQGLAKHEARHEAKHAARHGKHLDPHKPAAKVPKPAKAPPHKAK